jgi:hypothetical protein
MNSGHTARCEWPDAKRGPTFSNCAAEDDYIKAAERRIQQITSQLDCPHGLTNRERTAMANERIRWKRWLSQWSSVENPAAPTKSRKAARKEKATFKKLEWSARKFDRGSGKI